MKIAQDEIFEAVNTVVTSVIGTQLEAPACDEVIEPADALTGVVTISGTSDALVVLRCETGLARDLAAAMFAAPADELSDDEVVDAIGEVTNMTGGSIKAMLPGMSRLGLPSVTVGADHKVDVPGASTVGHGSFAHRGRSLSVTVLGSSEAGAQA